MALGFGTGSIDSYCGTWVWDRFHWFLLWVSYGVSGHWVCPHVPSLEQKLQDFWTIKDHEIVIGDLTLNRDSSASLIVKRNNGNCFIARQWFSSQWIPFWWFRTWNINKFRSHSRTFSSCLSSSAPLFPYPVSKPIFTATPNLQPTPPRKRSSPSSFAPKNWCLFVEINLSTSNQQPPKILKNLHDKK